MGSELSQTKEFLSSESSSLEELSRKWENHEWVKGQLLNHLIEVRELLESDDGHLTSEVLDLAWISRQFLRLREDATPALADHRWSKFAAHADKD